MKTWDEVSTTPPEWSAGAGCGRRGPRREKRGFLVTKIPPSSPSPALFFSWTTPRTVRRRRRRSSGSGGVILATLPNFMCSHPVSFQLSLLRCSPAIPSPLLTSLATFSPRRCFFTHLVGSRTRLGSRVRSAAWSIWWRGSSGGCDSGMILSC